MLSRLTSSPSLPKLFINWHQAVQRQAYSLSHEAAERIKHQLVPQQARLILPEKIQPTYPGLVILTTGPFTAGFSELKKLSDLYLQKGFAVVNVLHELVDFALCTTCNHKIDKVFDVLSSNVAESCPIVLKLYCTGSYSFLPPIIRRVSQPDCKFKITGIVFDSGPTYVRWESLRNARYHLEDLGKLKTRYQSLMQTVNSFIFGMLTSRIKHHYFKSYMFNPNPILHNIPQLYIYSLVDNIATLSYLQTIIYEQEKYGADVTTKVFLDTLHMMHRKKREEYDNAVLHFLTSKCKLPVYN